jgi:hypothetical protein
MDIQRRLGIDDAIVFSILRRDTEVVFNLLCSMIAPKNHMDLNAFNFRVQSTNRLDTYNVSVIWENCVSESLLIDATEDIVCKTIATYFPPAHVEFMRGIRENDVEFDGSEEKTYHLIVGIAKSIDFFMDRNHATMMKTTWQSKKSDDVETVKLARLNYLNGIKQYLYGIINLITTDLTFENWERTNTDERFETMLYIDQLKEIKSTIAGCAETFKKHISNYLTYRFAVIIQETVIRCLYDIEECLYLDQCIIAAKDVDSKWVDLICNQFVPEELHQGSITMFRIARDQANCFHIAIYRFNGETKRPLLETLLSAKP